LSGSTLVLLELLLVFGLVIGFGVWQLGSLERERRRREAAKSGRDDQKDG
jgi:hypothetical protein